MANVCLIDTSVLLNILDVPNRNQDRAAVMAEFASYIEGNYRFIIPFVVAVEVGNHISQNGDGRLRRAAASRFVKMMQDSLTGRSPFLLSEFDLKSEWGFWLGEFIEKAGQNKTPDKPNEGMSLTDLSIIKEFVDLQAKNQANRRQHVKVIIWSHDSDLKAYGDI